MADKDDTLLATQVFVDKLGEVDWPPPIARTKSYWWSPCLIKAIKKLAAFKHSVVFRPISRPLGPRHRAPEAVQHCIYC